MATFDPILKLATAIINGLADIREEAQENPAVAVETLIGIILDPDETIRRFIQRQFLGGPDQANVDAIQDGITSALGEVPEDIERNILQELPADEASDPDQVREAIDDAEGGAFQIGLLSMASGAGIESLSAGQVDGFQFELSQIMSFMALEDILGTELKAVMETGVAPALEARIGKEYRSNFVSLPDAHEYALRNKQGDEGYLSPENAPQKVIDAIGSNEPVNPDNLVEEWGIRDDNLEILEEVGLEAMEFEELIETPAELGLIVPPDVLDQTLDLAGYPEDLKDFLRKIPDEIPRSNRAWEERTAAEALIGELDDLVIEGTVTPADAIAMLPDEVDVARDALRDRFDLLADVEAGTPSQTDVEGALAFGGLSPDDFRDQLDAAEFPTDEFPGVVDATIVGNADGDLRTGVGLGLLSESDYVGLLTDAGLSEDVVDRLLRGEDLSDIATSRLTDETRAEGAGLQTIPQVGPDRAELLRDAEITTLQDVVDADPELIADALVISPEFAERLQTAAEIALDR